MIIPSGFGQATILFGGTALRFPGNVVFGFDDNADDGAAAAAEAIHGGFASCFMPVLSEELLLLTTFVKLGPNDTGPSAEFSDTVPGEILSDNAGPQVSFLLSKNTALGGRQGRGRMYLPGVGEDRYGDFGAISGATQSSLDDAAEAWLVLMALAGYPVQLLHGDSTAPTPVISMTTSGFIATQRRRMRR